jgi:hypothetical protein
MSKIVRTALAATSVAIAVGMAASAVQAQSVAMAGSYGEGNGIIVNIPQNPPNVACDPALAKCVGKRDLTPADLVTAMTSLGGTTNVPPALTVVPFLRDGPSFGVKGARLINTVGAAQDALNVGEQFTVPPLAFNQRLGHQVGQVLLNIVVQLDTTFTAAMPGSVRTKNNGVDQFQWSSTPTSMGRGLVTSTNPAYAGPPETRIMAQRLFSTADRVAHGQNNGLTTADPNYDYRMDVNTVHNHAFGADVLDLNYSNSDPLGGFTGTMAILLDGSGRLYLNSPGLSGAVAGATDPNNLKPIVGSNPVGDLIPGFNIRNAAGWNYTVPGRQLAGRIKAFGPAAPFIPGGQASAPGIVASKCGATAINDTCNLLANKFNDFGATVAPLGNAQSNKVMFAWTTGTVSIGRTGPRQGVVHTLTQTGMGYDSIAATPTAMGGAQRNVGLVAGSYSKRTSQGGTSLEMNTQIAGVDLRFTPEPGASIALLSGLGLLGALGVRRRS